VKGVVNAKPGVIEFVLNNLRVKVCLFISSYIARLTVCVVLHGFKI
jgi:hypothetical protein